MDCELEGGGVWRGGKVGLGVEVGELGGEGLRERRVHGGRCCVHDYCWWRGFAKFVDDNLRKQFERLLLDGAE